MINKVLNIKVLFFIIFIGFLICFIPNVKAADYFITYDYNYQREYQNTTLNKKFNTGLKLNWSLGGGSAAFIIDTEVKLLDSSSQVIFSDKKGSASTVEVKTSGGKIVFNYGPDSYTCDTAYTVGNRLQIMIVAWGDISTGQYQAQSIVKDVDTGLPLCGLLDNRFDFSQTPSSNAGPVYLHGNYNTTSTAPMIFYSFKIQDPASGTVTNFPTPVEEGYAYHWATTSTSSTPVTSVSSATTLYAVREVLTTYDVTYDYYYTHNFTSTRTNTNLDTGQTLDWNNPFKIETVVTIPNINAASDKTIISDFKNGSSTLDARVITGSSSFKTSIAGYISAGLTCTNLPSNTPLAITIEYNVGSVKSVSLSIKNNSTGVSICSTSTGPFTPTGSANPGNLFLHGYSGYSSPVEMTFSSFKITRTYPGGVVVNPLPSVKYPGYDTSWSTCSGGQCGISSISSARTVYAYRSNKLMYIVLGSPYTTQASPAEFYCMFGSMPCYPTSSMSGTAITSVTPPTRTGYTFGGYYTEENGGGTMLITSTGEFTSPGPYSYPTNSSRLELFPKWTINNPATPTISGGATKIYNSSATTLTCSTSTTYPSGTSLYYSFGYATSDGGTPSNWTTPTTSNTLTIAKDAYVGQRWYSCRAYATDGTQTSSTVASATTADTEMTIKNFQIYFNAHSNRAVIGNTNYKLLYSRYGSGDLYQQPLNSTTDTVPISTKEGYTFTGWWTEASGGTKVINANGTIIAGVSDWTNSSKKFTRTSNGMLYAQFTINNPATPTISGGATKIYNSSATTLTCSTSTTYTSETSLYYSFGYATSDGGTPSNWTTASTTATLTVAKDAYVGQRWYSCRVYASDGTLTSSTVASATTADTEMTINNAKITFNTSSNGGTISGTSPLYSKHGVASLYTGIRNTTAATIPTATKTGYTFAGWYTEASGGLKVINADKSVVAGVSNWTNASKQFLRTADSTLYAQFTPNTYKIVLDNQSATTAGTGQAWYQYNTSKTINGETCYYYTDSNLSSCLSDSKITLPEKDHYSFDGYYTEASGEGTKYITSAGEFTNDIYKKLPSEINENYTDEITLYANWIGDSITVTYPDDTTETYNYGDSFTFGTNDVAKSNENGAEITFKYMDNETDDTTSNVIKSFTPNGWKVGNTEYDDNEVITLTENITIEYNYTETKTSPEFPEPTRNHYIFDGWYDSEEEGNKIESYTGDEDINLYAYWTLDNNELTSSLLDIKERTLDGTDYRIIVGEEPNTPLEDFLAKLDNERATLKVFDKNGEEIENITDETYTATGMVVKLVINNNVLDEAIVIVRGDINEDGLVDAQDKVKLKNHLLGKDGFIIDDYKAFACDLVEDPEAVTIEAIVNAEDNARLANYLLGKPNSELNPHD